MKKILSLIFAALISTACTQTSPMANTNNVVQNANSSTVVSSHSTDLPTNSLPPSNKNSTESPMARPIDVTELNAAIERAERNPTDKKALAKAYFTRAFALTEAAQYRAALGDFRKGLKFDPNDADAKAMHDRILSIFKSINREPPKEGEEPAPLPFNAMSKTSGAKSDDRINFKPGETSAIATGDLKNYEDSKFFVIAVKQGQTLKTEQVKANDSTHYITVNIENPKGEPIGDSDASCNNRKEIAPTEAGDYKIKVFECKKADEWNGKFDLDVSVK